MRFFEDFDVVDCSDLRKKRIRTYRKSSMRSMLPNLKILL